MSRRRFLFVAALFAFAAIALLLRVFCISVTQRYADLAEAQSKRSSAYMTRAGFIDRNGSLLTGTKKTAYAVMIPGVEGNEIILEYIDQSEQDAYFEGEAEGRAYVLKLNRKPKKGFFVFESEERYSLGTAEHVIGYVNGDGDGVCGLEFALDDTLKTRASYNRLNFGVNAAGGLKSEGVIFEKVKDKSDIMLTLDADIQSIVEQVADRRIERGAIVVLKSDTAELLASASVPSYDRSNVAEYLNDTSLPMINRAFLAHNLGSVYKTVVAAAALESGIIPEYEYECTGTIVVDGQEYCCHNTNGHGRVDMREAFEQSCNTYFINLADIVGRESVHSLSKRFGLGERILFYEDYGTAGGSFPSLAVLKNSGEFSNLSFGQGRLTASPVHAAGLLNCVANGGVYIKPSLVVNGEDYRGVRLISEDTANILSEMLVGVVERGSGTAASSEKFICAGKTGTAQTGIYSGKKERIDHWFVGYFPADEPKVTIAVYVEGTQAITEYPTEIFSELAELISFYCFN